MKFAEISKRRLESLISYDEGIDKRELTLMVAQPIPARMKMGYWIQPLSAVIKLPTKKAEASIIMPARMVFFLPIFEATIPTGIYEAIAAACAIIRVRL